MFPRSHGRERAGVLMDQILAPPVGPVLAALLGAVAFASLGRAAWVFLRRPQSPEPAPMLRPIRAWLLLIFGFAMSLAAAGFALGLAWLIAFAAILAFVETLEASMMVQALEQEDRELSGTN